MSIFRRDDPSPPPQAAPQPTPKRAPASPPRQASTDSTHIASGSKVVGEISGDAELVVDGRVEGEIHLKSRLVVGREGHVQGRVVAQTIEVAGKIVGDVQGLEKVKVLESGTLEGDVASPRVVIDDGAFFKGNVDMTKKGAASPQKGGPGKGGGQSSQGQGSGQNRPGTKGQNDGNRQGSKVSQ